MDDLALLTEMADRTPLPTETDLAPARDRLLTAIAAEPEMRTRTRRRRFLISGAAVVGLAAAITAVVSLGGLEPVGVAPPEARAAVVLREAAAAARAQPFVAPRPDQFLYVKSQDALGVRESWRSVDGTQNGLAEQGGVREVLGACPVGETDCDPAYLPDLPTDKEGMAEYLRGGMSGVPSDTNYVGKTALALFGKILKPEARAALFEAVADFEGLTVDEHAVDPAGRSGIGISWSSNGWSGSFVLDATTYEYLGMPHESARLVTGVVDAIGQRP
jgi:hypothetical protein